MNEIVLGACRPEPLSSYLKALGVLRIVSEQRDPSALGAWVGDSFRLYTDMDEQQLAEFFVREYKPTPIVSPWNGGSGFYENDALEGITAISTSPDPRFSAYRRVIEDVRQWPEMPGTYGTVGEVTGTLAAVCAATRPGKKRDELEKVLESARDSVGKVRALFPGSDIDGLSLEALDGAGKRYKGKQKSDLAEAWRNIKKARGRCAAQERSQGKEGICRAARASLPEACLAWFDAAVVLKADGALTFNPVLGTGGNDGKLEFSNNFMQRVADLFIKGAPEETMPLLRTALFGSQGTGLTYASVGQFDPGRAGGYNQGSGIETKDFKINPWDFVLMMEGVMLLSGSAVKRGLAQARGFASVPFTVRVSSAGYASACAEEDARAETWLPTWRQPASLAEVRYVFGEGRSAVGRKPARNGLDFSRSVSTLGVDRGLDGFVRYSFVVRKGKSYVALPAGRFSVRYRPAVRLLDDLDNVLSNADRYMRQTKTPPTTLKNLRRGVDEAAFACSQMPDTRTFSALVRALGRLERWIALQSAAKKPAVPLGGLSPAWVVQCDDGAVEVRLAAALASIRSTGKVGSIRANLAGTDPGAPWRWADGNGQQRWAGNSLSERLGNVLAQRIMDARRLGVGKVPVWGRLSLHPVDVAFFLLGQTDDVCVEELLWGFTLIRWNKAGLEEIQQPWRKAISNTVVPRSYALLKLLHVPEAVRDRVLRIEPRILGMLRAGRVQDACQIAYHRLMVSDCHPMKVQQESWVDPRRLLASLMVPVHGVRRLEDLVLKPTTLKERSE